MKILNLVGSSVFQIVSVIFFIIYLFGVINVHFTDKNDYCIMTYMYEYPQYVRISLPENAVYPQYGLYAYSEGRLTERARKMWFNGIPVLFLPGNSGSYKQVRSLASVALRKALDRTKNEFHFDYFTISYNEELSGLYGGVLESETKFAAASILKILSLYKSNRYTKTIPKSVILIGHSMGGVIAKRLLAYPSMLNSTNLAITLAAPLQAPVLNTDYLMDEYYKHMQYEWELNVKNNTQVKAKKLIISFGNGPRDVLMPSGLTSSNESYIGALTTSLPGAWVSPDHVSIVWCKQVVMAINRYLFSLIDPLSDQLYEDSQMWKLNADFYFQANRSMILRPDRPRANSTMLADAFWFEDSRRIYQISRPEVNRMTYLMIRLVTFPQNRFVAIEANNLDDKEWIYGCNAMYIYGTYRYCKQATSLSELSRWTGAAEDHGQRKLATIDLHKLKDDHPDWTHVVVKISPTRKPVILNVDVNDHGSRVINVDLPSEFTFGKTVIRQETEVNSLYYELILRDFNAVHQAYLLYVEPTENCKASQYHVSAELHVPWAKNHEYFHYYTPLKRSPMKLRLYSSNPNMTELNPEKFPKVTLLLDPQCTYTISISSSWYNRLAQLARNYSPVLVPYVGAIVLLAARSSFINLKDHGTCLSFHGALMSEGIKPYYALVFARLSATFIMSVPILSIMLETASWNNLEMQYFTKSLLVLPAYMAALGLLTVGAAAAIAVMVFSSQLAHRLLFRIVWRGGSSFAERVASGLQKVPLVVSAAMICAVPLSCGAASLVVGAAFYAFMISKMYEEYLEDYIYKLMAKTASRMCYNMFKSKRKPPTEEQTSLIPKDNAEASTSGEISVQDKNVENKDSDENRKTKDVENKDKTSNKEVAVIKSSKSENKDDLKKKCKRTGDRKTGNLNDIDEELNNLNFHVMMFFLWVCVTLLNVPVLLTWARNFKYGMVLKPDTSYHAGVLMSFCSGCIWQIDSPRLKLRNYENLSALLFTMAICIIALGPFSLTIVNYGITIMFAIITLQQLFDSEEDSSVIGDNPDDNSQENPEHGSEEKSENKENDNKTNTEDEEKVTEDKETNTEDKDTSTEGEDTSKEGKEGDKSSECDVCDENRIYTMFKNIKDKFSLMGEESDI